MIDLIDVESLFSGVFRYFQHLSQAGFEVHNISFVDLYVRLNVFHSVKCISIIDLRF
jgi:hypothetical protein